MNRIPFSKAQATLEALMSLATLLLALALFIASAQHLGSKLNALSQSSSERYLLSHEALSIDTAAALPGTSAPRIFHGFPSGKGNGLRSRISNVSQPVFSRISSDSRGNFYAVHECCEPI
ncbi:MAG: hypothetical protein QW568_00605 [Candidatus Anstonellaceae archaeon]